ncbi:hypothetical protein EVAR_23133_1 [Eumeta japonica]|uniref:Uncharacterized protein n=1 Tax=Eumeta variegata TaxID=151549 RepID=A0A4C1VD62_EUMVA|nr:hypothetical protein EVAR_23133_1 [Eumeta japonica]
MTTVNPPPLFKEKGGEELLNITPSMRRKTESEHVMVVPPKLFDLCHPNVSYYEMLQNATKFGGVGQFYPVDGTNKTILP